MPAGAPAKKPTLAQILDALEGLHGKPVLLDRLEDPLIDHLLVAVLGLYTAEKDAREGVRALSQAFLDMNEARASPLAELKQVLEPHLPAERLEKAAYDVRMALQDVWDGCHGLDLESLRGRTPEDQRAFLKDLPNTPGGPAALVFQVALGEKSLTLGPREKNLLSRFGLLPRSSTPQKLRQNMERKIKPAERMRFTWLTGAASRMYEEDWDESHPFCQLLIAAKAKEVVERERARKRDEIRRVQEEKKRKIEEARRQKAEAVAAKKRERDEKRRQAEEARKAREAEKKRQIQEARKKAQDERKAAIEARRREAADKKRALADARRKAVEEKKRAAEEKRKAEAAKKKAEADRKKAEAARRKAEAAKRKAEAAKKKAEAAKKKADAEKKRKAEAAKKKAEAAKKKADAEKKRKADAAAKKKAAQQKAAQQKAAAKKKAPAAKKPAARKGGSAGKSAGAARRRPPARKK
jgi:hypothetical protein